MKRIKKIVVATDFSDIAARALDEAVDLAEQLGATITLVHSYEIPVYGFPDGILVGSSDVAASLAEGGQRGLEAAIAKQKGRPVAITPSLRCGPAWDEVNAVASDVGADLIVVGTHGRRGFARAMLGSTAERIVRTATRSVLVVHGGQSGPTGPSRTA
jgi:nucleotide-binding universal stress UspA family protein